MQEPCGRLGEPTDDLVESWLDLLMERHGD